jgi:hypothetical protein
MSARILLPLLLYCGCAAPIAAAALSRVARAPWPGPGRAESWDTAILLASATLEERVLFVMGWAAGDGDGDEVGDFEAMEVIGVDFLGKEVEGAGVALGEVVVAFGADLVVVEEVGLDAVVDAALDAAVDDFVDAVVFAADAVLDVAVDLEEGTGAALGVAVDFGAALLDFAVALLVLAAAVDAFAVE